MHFTQGTLFFPTGIVCAALAVTVISVWATARGNTFLSTWAAGTACIALAGLVLTVSGGLPWQIVNLFSYSFLVVGLTIVLLAGHRFRENRTPWGQAAALGGLGLLPVAALFLFGLPAPGTILLNFVAALLLSLTARQYWLARAEAPACLIGICVLYAMIAFSFGLCGLWLLHSNPLVLDAPPDNPAERFNAVVDLIGSIGIGALSLAVNQSRVARSHRLEAHTDPLTGLLNRRALFESVGLGGIAANTAVIIFDLDGFKAINDRFGHAVGDEVLRRFAATLKQAKRSEDYAVRLGGEEFVLVMPAVSLEIAIQRAERVRQQFKNETVSTEAGVACASTSAGVATAGLVDERLDVVLSRADTALYRAKASGRDRVVSSAVRLVA